MQLPEKNGKQNGKGEKIRRGNLQQFEIDFLTYLCNIIVTTTYRLSKNILLEARVSTPVGEGLFLPGTRKCST